MDYSIFYSSTYKYLLQKAKEHNIDEAELAQYFLPDTGNSDFFRTYDQNSLNNLLFRFAFHAQNGGQISKVIKFPTNNTAEHKKRLDKFKSVFCNFDPSDLITKYGDVQALFEKFTEAFHFPEISSLSKTGDHKRSMPYKYCKSVYSAATLLVQYSDHDAFINKLRSYGDMAPIYISFEVYGFSIALACDFIKELPELNIDLPKPDVHILKILFELGYLEKQDGDIAKYQTIRKFKEIVSEIKKAYPSITSYKLDRMLWLICTETFYKHDDIRNTTDAKRKAYIEYIKKELSQ